MHSRPKFVIALIATFVTADLIGGILFWPVANGVMQAYLNPRTGQDVVWSVHFSPKGGCTDSIVTLIEQAKKEILVQAYSFTSPPIAQALIEAKMRGVRVRVILDKSNLKGKYSRAGILHAAGVPVWIDGKHAIAHNKVIVVDGERVITGSFNFTVQAEMANAENSLIITDADLAVKYRENWQKHYEHSEVYRP